MTMQCEIKWVGEEDHGESSDAVCEIRTKEYSAPAAGRSYPIKFNASRWFPCCAKHKEALNKPGMHIWEARELG